jgi:hypothetical protein
MTQIILHRINTINQLKTAPKKFGVEVDVRSNNGFLILHHEPFKKGPDFSKWLKYYSHAYLIINIKEEGLEIPILKLLQKFKVKKFFFLDQSFPFLIKFSKKLLMNAAARFSELESIETVINIKSKIKWVWVDCFTKLPITKNNFTALKKVNVKICYVSPELQGEKNIKKIKNFVAYIKDKKLIPDAVCTKFPDFWNSL